MKPKEHAELVNNLLVACTGLAVQYEQLMRVHHGAVFTEYSDPYLIDAKAAMQAIEESQL